jgi:hypothetical protein
MVNIVNINGVEDDIAFLERIIEAHKEKRKTYKKIVVIALDDSDGKYNISLSSNNLKRSEIISLIEIAKISNAGDMGFV